MSYYDGYEASQAAAFEAYMNEVDVPPVVVKAEPGTLLYDIQFRAAAVRYVDGEIQQGFSLGTWIRLSDKSMMERAVRLAADYYKEHYGLPLD